MKIHSRYYVRIITSILFIYFLLSIYNISYASYLTDISNHWAKDTINKWTSYGLVKGYNDGSFRPNNYITRAEFVAIINRITKPDNYREINYSDVSKESWYYFDMAKAVNEGYLNGYGDNTLRPNEYITREEVASILFKLVEVENKDNPDINILNQFEDSASISIWSQKALALSVEKGFITGYEDNTLRSYNNITRAETIVVLDRIYSNIVDDFKENINDFKVIGYYSYWSSDTPEMISYDGLTHINYAFATPLLDGNVYVQKPDRLRILVNEAHKKDIKVYIAVGGWGYDEEFSYIASDKDRTQTFVNSIVDIVMEYNLDGVDIDWEYPDYGEEPYNLIKLMKELKESLNKLNKGLTAAIIAGITQNGYETLAGKGIKKEIVDIVDWLNIMAYDGQNGLLYPNHSPYIFAENSIRYWKDVRDFPYNKLVLGVPFYGKTYDGKNITYEKIVKEDSTAPYKNYSNGYYYNGINTIQIKTSLAINEVNGIMIWELSQDTNYQDISLLNAINDILH